jgi:N-acyl-D-amino-acid deacylase
MLDIAILGGTVIDGSGVPGQRIDVGILGERIVRLGKISPAEAKQVFDAAGCAVAPGFIDVHNHSEGWLLKLPHFVPKLSQGFTTEILMSDGISYAPVTDQNWNQWFLYLRSLNGLLPEDYSGWHTIADYLALLDGRTAQNVAALIPYANLRVIAAGWRRDVLDDTQVRIMRREVEQAMEAGAVGISTGLDYISECFATTDELAEVCAAMAPWQGVYVTHVRYKKGTLRAVQEAVEIGRRAGVPVHISHLKAGSVEEREQLFDYIERVATNEVDFSFDVYPYMPGSTMLNFLLPYEVWENGPSRVVERLSDPSVRSNVTTLLNVFVPSFEQIRFAWFSQPRSAEWRGRTFAEYVRATGKSPGDALCDLLIEENLQGLAVISGGDDTLIEPWLQHDRFMLGSDGIFFPDGLVHPRMYGSAPRILGPMVRDRRLFSLETAVQKMTSIPARRFGLTDRGVIREGAFADLVVFNPDTITDRATYANPSQLSTGIEQVLVNGQRVYTPASPAEGLPTPGRALSR